MHGAFVGGVQRPTCAGQCVKTALTLVGAAGLGHVPMPTADEIARCDDVLNRLVPAIGQILEFLRKQTRHPDTSWLAPTELFTATNLYLCVNRIVTRTSFALFRP